MTQLSRAAARWPLLLLPLLLGACAGGVSEYPPPSTAATPAAASATATAEEAPAAKPKPTRAARAPAPKPDAEAEPEENKGPMTHARASAECWMLAEKGHPSLEVREKMVDKCIDQKMKAASRPQPQTQ
jgi:hypothetical protein